MGIIHLLASNNYIVVNKFLIKLIGLEEAIMLGELASEYQYWESNEELTDGFFYSTVDNIEENTGFSIYQQRKALKHLENEGIIEIKYKGIPPLRYIKINENKLLEKMDFKRVKNSLFKELKTNAMKSEKLTTNNNNIKIINNNKKNILNKFNILKSDNLEQEFEKIWKQYPNKKGKAKSLNCYLKARKDGVSYETILNGVSKYAQYVKETNRDIQYVKNGSTWFNQKCWEDEYEKVETEEEWEKRLKKEIEEEANEHYRS